MTGPTHDWPDAVDVADWCDPRRVALWYAVNEYAAACGGDPGNAAISGRHMDAVVAVERVMRSYTHPSGPDGNRVLVPVREPTAYPKPPDPLVGRPSFWVTVVVVIVWAAAILAAS